MIDFKQLRKQSNFTLRQVEERTGISNAYLSQLENGKIRKPSHDIVQKLNKLYKQQNIELPIEFINWLGDNYLKLHGGWIPKYANQIKTTPISTEEMYKLFSSVQWTLLNPKF